MQPYLEDYEKGKDIDQLKPVYQLPTIQKKTAHQVLVDEILKSSNQDKGQYKFWLGMISRSKLSMNAILDLCDKARKLPEPYSKGGFIRNRL